MAYTTTLMSSSGPRKATPKGVFMGTVRCNGSAESDGELAEIFDDGVFGKGIDVRAMSVEEKTAFLGLVANTMQTHLSGYDPLPNTANSEETVTGGIKSLFKEGKVSRNAEGGFTTKLRFANVRHAEGYHNLGMHQTADAHLTPKGQGQSVDMGLQMSASSMPASDFDFVSTLVRCKETRDGIYSSLSHLPIPPSIRTSVFQENPHSYIRGVPGPSSVDPSLIADDEILWNGAAAKGRDDPLAPVLNESKVHMAHRTWEGLGLMMKSASVFTGLTGKADVRIKNFGHADYFRELTKNLRSLAGLPEDEDACGYFNTEIKEFEIWLDTDADGVITVRPQDDEQGSLVTFGKGITPDFGLEYRAIQERTRSHKKEQRDAIATLCARYGMPIDEATSPSSTDKLTTVGSGDGKLLAELRSNFDSWLKARNSVPTSAVHADRSNALPLDSAMDASPFATSISALC